ncbi:alpha/beta fold hydrolase [Dongshaea marina]|uniref:alpha/beta fold hydrolase n=1 Tax=Dongshaea marina TaxID=2047966 RepID=UPI003899178C
MQLSYRILGQGQPILLLHGLFGDRGNLNVIAKHLEPDMQVISVDLRNHGDSPHSDTHDYPSMAQDILKLLETLELNQCHLLGHSMGGKVAMQLALIAPERILSLMVADMAPVPYTEDRHSAVFKALKQVEQARVSSRQQAEQLLSTQLDCPATRQFLLKSLTLKSGYGQWKFNRAALEANYQNIMDWPSQDSQYPGPTLFIKGGESDYIQAAHQQAIAGLFPNAQAKVILGTGHWLHAEKPRLFNRTISEFLCSAVNSQTGTMI